MKQGKKTIAEKAIMIAFYKVKKSIYKKPVLLLLDLMLRLKPLLSIMIRRKGKQYIDLPIPLTPKQQLMLSLK
jgi:ribosomal protein S7